MARRLYASDAMLFPVRLGVATAPLVGVASLLLGLIVVLPRPVGLWAAVPASMLVAVAIVSSYRIPAVMLPGWLRDDLASGRLPPARPDGIDWLLLAVVGPALLLGPAAIVLWALVLAPSGG